jgi:hypothetical protein
MVYLADDKDDISKKLKESGMSQQDNNESNS